MFPVFPESLNQELIYADLKIFFAFFSFVINRIKYVLSPSDGKLVSWQKNKIDSIISRQLAACSVMACQIEIATDHY